MLDLDVDVRPCPKGGSVWRNKVIEMGGKAQFPFLVDENTGEGNRRAKYAINLLAEIIHALYALCTSLLWLTSWTIALSLL